MTETERYAWFWREVVYQAMRDIISPQAQGASIEDTADAIDWMQSDTIGIGSFWWACREGGIDATEVKRVVARRLN